MTMIEEAYLKQHRPRSTYAEKNGTFTPYRWNWDSPLMISPHSHTRLYFAVNMPFRSDDRGNTSYKS
jgi:hypothetical protein